MDNEKIVSFTMIPRLDTLSRILWEINKERAELIYYKCIKAKKYKWAMQLAFYYDIQDNKKKDDTVISAGMLLLCNKLN